MTKKIKPVSRTTKIDTEIKRIAGEVFPRRRRVVDWIESWVPCVDIHENRDVVFVEIEVPGVNEHDIQIMLHSNRIEVKGHKKETPAPGFVRYFRLEREFGRFERNIYLPCLVLPEKASATLENGILTISAKKLTKKIDKEVILTIDKSVD